MSYVRCQMSDTRYQMQDIIYQASFYQVKFGPKPLFHSNVFSCCIWPAKKVSIFFCIKAIKNVLSLGPFWVSRKSFDKLENFGKKKGIFLK